MTPRRLPALARLAPALALVLAALGCDTGEPGAGLVNGPRPTSASENPATRTDLPVNTTPGTDEILGDLGDTETDGGAAARGGGDEGAYPDQPKADPDDESVRATPPAIETGSGTPE